MTEQEWLDCKEPKKMLKLMGRKASDRKLRLSICGCCRSVSHLLNDELCERVVDIAERYADSKASKSELGNLRRRTRDASERSGATCNTSIDDPYTHARLSVEVYIYLALYCLTHPLITATDQVASRLAHAAACFDYAAVVASHGITHAQETLVYHNSYTNARKSQTGLLRCIFGNPFCPATLPPAVLAWNDGTIPRLAQAIYDERAFDRLAVHADALEEAGCTYADILAHCRSAEPHIRGCWAIDLILGES